MRKHRLAERLLVDVLGLEHEYVHEEACRWEHVISDRVEQRLVEFLGNPTTSPYGNPIPGSGEGFDDIVSLAEVGAEVVTVHSISEHLQADAEVMHVLHEYGMIAGERAEVTRRRRGGRAGTGGSPDRAERGSVPLRLRRTGGPRRGLTPPRPAPLSGCSATVSAQRCSSSTVSSQPMHASVMETPCSSGASGDQSWRPGAGCSRA
jgi:hypothetical protein